MKQKNDGDRRNVCKKKIVENKRVKVGKRKLKQGKQISCLLTPLPPTHTQAVCYSGSSVFSLSSHE